MRLMKSNVGTVLVTAVIIGLVILFALVRSRPARPTPHRQPVLRGQTAPQGR